MLFVFAKEPSLRAVPFNIYLMNLLVANLAVLIMQYTVDIAINLHTGIWLMNDALCGAFLYGCFVLQVKRKADSVAHEGLYKLNSSPQSYST